MSSRRRARSKDRRPTPGAMPGTLVVPPGAPKPVIRVMDYSSHRLEERTLASPSEVVPYLADAHPSVTWVDVQGLGETKILEELRDIFHIHPLALADVVNVPQRSKVENFERYLFVITRMTLESGEAEFHSEQVSLFIGKTFVLTFQETYGDCLDPVRARIRSGAGLLRKSGPDYLAYAIIDALVDHYFPAVESLGERLEELEDEAVHAPTPDTLRRIYSVKRELLELRRGIWPQREAINALLHDDSGLVGREVHVYLRDCYDHAVQLIEVVESLRELATGLLDVYMSSVAQRTNEIMRVLTVVTTIFIPLTFLAGVYGMNFKTEVSDWNMPELSWRFGYPAILGAMFLIALGLLLLFARMGWLRSGAASLKAADARRGLGRRGDGSAAARGSGPAPGVGSPSPPAA